MKVRPSFLIFTIIAGLLSSCSIQSILVDQVGNALGASSTSTFLSDNDPELVRDALPFALKTFEALCASAPENVGLRITTGSAFLLYANAFIQAPADLMEWDQFEEQQFAYERAKKMYIRSSEYLIEALIIRHPDLNPGTAPDQLERLLGYENYEEIDYEILYWLGSSWLAVVSLNPFDMEYSSVSLFAIPLLEMVKNRLGPLPGMDSTLLAAYASLPESMGGSKAAARTILEQALEENNPGPVVGFATSVSVSEQNYQEFLDLLNFSLEIDPDSRESDRLLVILSQRRAAWFLDHADEYFLITTEPEL
jgi:predicted anti-sigma-YlaC factor YlaD